MQNRMDNDAYDNFSGNTNDEITTIVKDRAQKIIGNERISPVIYTEDEEEKEEEEESDEDGDSTVGQANAT